MFPNPVSSKLLNKVLFSLHSIELHVNLVDDDLLLNISIKNLELLFYPSSSRLHHFSLVKEVD